MDSDSKKEPLYQLQQHVYFVTEKECRMEI